MFNLNALLGTITPATAALIAIDLADSASLMAEDFVNSDDGDLLELGSLLETFERVCSIGVSVVGASAFLDSLGDRGLGVVLNISGLCQLCLVNAPAVRELRSVALGS